METLVDLKTMLEIDGRDYAMTVTGITIADASIGPYEFWGSRYVDPYTPGIEGWEIGRIVEMGETGERILAGDEAQDMRNRIKMDNDLCERIDERIMEVVYAGGLEEE